MKNILFLLSSLVLTFKLIAQVPTVSGQVNVSVQKGTIDCEFTLGDIPKISNYEILLNAGLNVQYFTNADFPNNIAYKRSYDEGLSYESFLYHFPNADNDGKFLPNTLDVKYTGKFPVRSDTFGLDKSGDWRGNIAFMDNVLRMDGVQSNWYPILYDVDNDKWYDEVNYDITVSCSDCRTLYLNGAQPVYDTKHRFVSKQPVELFALFGDYEFYRVNDTYYLNPDINEKEMKRFSLMVKAYKDYYAEKLGIPYGRPITFVQGPPTTLNSAFSFVAFPTIINIGRNEFGLKSFVKEDNTSSRSIIAHELAHFYFGSGYKNFNSVLYGIIQEGFAEYMSYQATKALLGIDFYTQRIQNNLQYLAKSNIAFVPLSKIKTKEDIGNYYRYAYTYFPVILSAIEKEVGTKAMWKWLRLILQTPSTFTNYDFLRETLFMTSKDEKKVNLIIEKYFVSEDATNNALSRLK